MSAVAAGFLAGAGFGAIGGFYVALAWLRRMVGVEKRSKIRCVERRGAADIRAVEDNARFARAAAGFFTTATEAARTDSGQPGAS